MNHPSLASRLELKGSVDQKIVVKIMFMLAF